MGAMTPSRRLPALLSIALLAAACSSGGALPDPGEPSPGSAGGPPAASSGAPSGAASGAASASTAPSPDANPTAPAPVLAQAWATAELTDVATGDSFTLAGLAGRTIILEPMAIWCSTCFAQQGHVYEALAELDPDRVTYVLIDVDASETPEALGAYRERHGFTGTYAVATRDMARALIEEFGDQVVNPPSAPMVLIAADGRVTLAPFGQKSATEIVELARQHGA